MNVGLTFDDVLLIPQKSRVRSRADVDVSTTLTEDFRLPIPILSANTPWCTEDQMAIALARLGGLGIIHRMQPLERQAAQVRRVKKLEFDPLVGFDAAVDPHGFLRVGAATGIKGDFIERSESLVDEGADLIVVDVAHAHSEQALEAVATLRRHFPEVALMVGNVATEEGTLDVIAAGAQCVKVGIGPGGICTTRIVAGSGVPQITAILDCSNAARPHGVPIIADGGIRQPGDIAKAVAAGASAVMLGSMLAGSSESTAVPITRDGKTYKISTGYVSFGMEITLKLQKEEPVDAFELEHYVPEGVEATFPFTGPVKDTIIRCVGGLRSGISYSGGTCIADMWQNARFIRVAEGGRSENRPHATETVPQLQPNYRETLSGILSQRSEPHQPDFQ